MDKLVELFCCVDDFCEAFLPQWQKFQLENGERKRKRQMSESEIMTIIAFHMSNHRDLKNFYIGMVHRFYKKDFPTLLSYTRFLEVMPSVLVPLSSFFTHMLKENLRELSLLIQPVSRYAITYAFQDTKLLMAQPPEAKAQWYGSMDLNCILLPII